jgi:stromal membrane-associated protein
MDLWTKEQVEVRLSHLSQCFRCELLVPQNMRQAGNIKSNQTYNPDEVRNPPPTNMIDAERDSELEKFIRGR